MEEMLLKLLMSGGGTVITLVGVLVLYKAGVLQYLIGKKNGNGNKEITELKNEFENLRENHLHELKDILTEIKDELKEINEKQSEALFILKRMEK